VLQRSLGSVLSRIITISNMGRWALRSHGSDRTREACRRQYPRSTRTCLARVRAVCLSRLTPRPASNAICQAVRKGRRAGACGHPSQRVAGVLQAGGVAQRQRVGVSCRARFGARGYPRVPVALPRMSTCGRHGHHPRRHPSSQLRGRRSTAR
jgi:hypothetical protein